MLFTSSLRKTLNWALALVLINISLIQVAQAQLSYRKGQQIETAYEGWRENADGTITMTFGYFNENWEEEPNIPVGDSNFFSPGEADRGQPTHFLPRRNRFTFDVIVPGDFGDQELVWTVTSSNGETRKAYGTLLVDYIIDNIIIASETGSLGAGTSSPESRANIPPVAKVIGDSRRTVKVGEPLLVRTEVTDDGIPKPRSFGGFESTTTDGESAEDEPSAEEKFRNRLERRPTQVTVGKTNGLYLSWNVYRGEGSVAFDPPQPKAWEDTRATANSAWGAIWTPPPIPEDGMYEVEVTFDEPGQYVLWGRADDGGLYHDQFIEVTVQP
ncbi:MAG: hypothetical protein HOF74_00175 [Gammaproteobacteria bacterium]|jgi:hypothetical protein|nr:hypothetical protein [Gammaproteobacteria bacterium]MBT3858222.1 hypothetical protein [Gammaproteobacteria bacterium]MBT3988662.1 hypothetical protein [Gammaproteobacteria bacterium]MBT4255548.1 hypothetical protein [Gammaproteobacteria bacterium]MBT4580618.1 hypothetical protein [Gammaproteobacteria bacterium]